MIKELLDDPEFMKVVTLVLYSNLAFIVGMIIVGKFL